MEVVLVVLGGEVEEVEEVGTGREWRGGVGEEVKGSV